MQEALTDFLLLLAILDPVTTLSLFVGVTSGMDSRERKRIAVRCVAYTTIILVGAMVAGQVVLSALGIRLATFQFAGGVILFLFGIQMVLGSGAASMEGESDQDHDVAVYPLTVPSLAGPGAILAVVVLTDNDRNSLEDQLVTAGALFVVLAITLVTLLAAGPIYRIIGRAGANVLVRLLGLMVAALAVEMVLESLPALILAIQA